MTSEESLAGRTDLVTRIVDGVGQHSVRGVTLVGPPGIGKSALARAITARLGSTFEPVFVAGTPASADIPLGAFAAFLPPVGTEPGIASLVHVRRAITGAEGDVRRLLVVDDAHCLDETSAALLHQVVAAGTPAIVTQRTGAPSPEAVNRLWRDQLLERVDVGPLDTSAVAELLEHLLGGAADPRVAEDVWRRTHGNPLYVRELVLGGREAGEWSPGASGWTWTAGSATPRLGDLLRDRLGRLSDEERSALEHLAFGEPLGLGEMERICGIEVLERLEALDLVTADLDRRRLSIRHAHPLHAELVRRTVTALRARAIRRALVDALRATGTRRRDDLMRLATLAVDAGADVERATLVDAARVALASGEHGTALRLATVAFEHEPDFATGQLVADALHVDGSFDEIAAHWPAWAATAVDPSERALLAMHRASSLYYRAGDERDALQTLALALEDDTPDVLADEITALTATLHAMSGRTSAALELARPVLDRSASGRAIAQAGLAVTQAMRAAGSTDDAEALNRAAMSQLEAHDRADALLPKSAYGANQAAILLTAGRIDEALRAADDAVDVARQGGAVISEGLALLARADALAMLGRLDDAMASARRSEATFVHANHPCYRAWAIATRAYVAALAGDDDGVAAARTDLIALGETPAKLYTERVLLATSIVGFGADPAGVAEALLRTARTIAEQGDVDGAIRCVYELVRLGSSVGRVELVTWCAGSQSALHHVMAAHAESPDDPDALGDVAARFVALGARLFAADAALRAARLAEERRARTAARRWERTADTLVPERRTVTVPDDRHTSAALPSAIVLTRREQEVASLAARGLSSRAIGEQLFLSPRTVENHLARVYQKLGISSRAALAKELATA